MIFPIYALLSHKAAHDLVWNRFSKRKQKLLISLLIWLLSFLIEFSNILSRNLDLMPIQSSLTEFVMLLM